MDRKTRKWEPISIQPDWCNKYTQLIDLLEPIGAKAPTFQGESIGSVFRKSSGHDIVLLCQAQAYPVPLIR